MPLTSAGRLMSELPTHIPESGFTDAGVASVADNAVPHNAQPVAPGAWLAATREAYGLTVEQVASQLNLAPRQVVALEADNYAALPGMVIVRGFLRAYAKLLKVDPVPLLALLADPLKTPSSAPMRHALSASFSETRLPSRTGTTGKRWVMPLMAGAVVLVIVAAATYTLGWWPETLTRRISAMRQGDGAQAAVAGSAGASSATTEIAGLTSSNTLAGAATGVLPPESAASTDATVDTRAALTIAPAVGLLPATAIGAPVSGTSTNDASTGAAANGAADNALVLTVQEDSWVEIKRADNTVLIARVMKAGAVESFDVSQPVMLTIGNIAGVEARLRGQPLALASAATGNVARLRLK
jgi:cytoskeleton protein RodZ